MEQNIVYVKGELIDLRFMNCEQEVFIKNSLLIRNPNFLEDFNQQRQQNVLRSDQNRTPSPAPSVQSEFSDHYFVSPPSTPEGQEEQVQEEQVPEQVPEEQVPEQVPEPVPVQTATNVIVESPEGRFWLNQLFNVPPATVSNYIFKKKNFR